MGYRKAGGQSDLGVQANGLWLADPSAPLPSHLVRTSDKVQATGHVTRRTSWQAPKDGV